MRRWKKELAGLLLFCMSFTVIPAEASAAKDIDAAQEKSVQTEAVQKETGQQEALPGGVKEKEAENKDTVLQEAGQEEAEPESSEQKEAEPESSEQNGKAGTGAEPGKILRNTEPEDSGLEDMALTDDPGWGRYSGYASPGFYGPSGRVVNDKIQHDSRFNGYIIQEGIDVSEWNGNIDWTKVKEAGYEFAIIRVSGTWSRESGGQFMDSRAIQNIEGALRAGMSIGVYHFSQAITEKEAQKEAQYILNAIQPYKGRIALPVVFDFEYVSGSDGEGGRLYDAHLTKSKATKICNKFCETVEASGLSSMVYSNPSMLGNQLNPADLAAPVWLAQWANAVSYSGSYEYWQYSATGRVPGINGEVDLDFRYVQKGPLTITAVSAGSIRMEWKPVQAASGYNIYRKSGDGDYQLVGSAAGGETVSYSDKNLKEAVTYTYRVRSYTDTEAGRQNGFYTKTAKATTKINGTSLTGEAVAFDTVYLSWAKASSASGYQIQRYNSAKKTYQTIKTLSGKSKVSCKDKGLNAGKNYKYRIRAYKNVDGTKIYSTWSKVTAVKTLGTVKGTVTASGVNVRSGAGTNYKVLKTAGKNKRFKINGSSGKWYRISLKVNGKTRNGYIQKKYVKLDMASLKPVLKVSNLTPSKNALSWYQMPEASGYQIQRYDSARKTYRTVKTAGKSRTSYTNGGLKANTAYKYRIRAYQKVKGKKVYSKWSAAKSTRTGN
ncbi:GH25 family lysozyme [Lachnospiraceae bacterium 48-42]|nr:SH3 domain-containing protein [Dorea sp.]